MFCGLYSVNYISLSLVFSPILFLRMFIFFPAVQSFKFSCCFCLHVSFVPLSLSKLLGLVVASLLDFVHVKYLYRFFLEAMSDEAA